MGIQVEFKIQFQLLSNTTLYDTVFLFSATSMYEYSGNYHKQIGERLFVFQKDSLENTKPSLGSLQLSEPPAALGGSWGGAHRWEWAGGSPQFSSSAPFPQSSTPSQWKARGKHVVRFPQGKYPFGHRGGTVAPSASEKSAWEGTKTSCNSKKESIRPNSVRVIPSNFHKDPVSWIGLVFFLAHNFYVQFKQSQSYLMPAKPRK